MSFSTEQKREITEQQYKNPCCRRALLCGALVAKASVNGDSVSFASNYGFVLDFISGLVSEFYGKTPERFRSALGGRGETLSFGSRSCARYLNDVENSIAPFSAKCAFCRSSFFRGLFLACGRVSNPDVQYLLEFAPAARHEMIARTLSSYGIEAKYTERKKEKLFYVKKSSAIEDFFALAGMNTTAFQFINTKIANSLRNSANRIANCETNNIGKAVNASHQQIEVIEALSAKGLLSSLPDELKQTAVLRLENKSLSLSALSRISVPPLSKSGLSHRLDKILELGRELLEKEK